MKQFRSVALDREGRKYAGTFEAENEAEALRMLHEQGFQVLSLEEIKAPDVEVEDPAKLKAKARIEKKKGPVSTQELPKAGFIARGAGLGSGFWKTLGIAAFVLGGLPLLVYVFAPRPPLNKPEEAARGYFETEFAGDYAAQYELFSSGRKLLAGTRDAYVSKRAAEEASRRKSQAALTPELSEEDIRARDEERAPKLAGVEELSNSGSEAEAAAFIIRSPMHEEYHVRLLLEDRYWKVREVKLTKRKELARQQPAAEVEEEDVSNTGKEAVKTPPPPSEKKNVNAPPASTSQGASSPAPAGKPNVNAAKDQALALLEEARDREVITESEFQTRKKQLGL